jgi:hypothetical protein
MYQFKPCAAALLVEAECDDGLLAGRPCGIPVVAHEFRRADFEIFAGDDAGDLLWSLTVAGRGCAAHDDAILAPDAQVGFGFEADEVYGAHPLLHLLGIGPSGEDALTRGAKETVDVDV